MSIANLISKVQKLNGGLPFMEGKEKGEIIMGTLYLINDFGFLNGNDGEYVVFTVKGNDSHFFFGGSVLTEKMKELENILTEDEIAQILNEGLEVIFEQKKAEKTKRNYVACEFFPNAK